MKSYLAITLLSHLVFLFLSTASAQEVRSNQLQTCTLLGCGPDNFAVSVRVADGSDPTTLPDLVVEVDGDVATCAGLTPDPTELYGTPCGENSNVRLSIAPGWDCATSGECTLTGKSALRIFVIGTPKKVRVRFVDMPSEHASFEPKYEDRFPNGAHCPPPCRNARAVWSVSRPW